MDDSDRVFVDVTDNVILEVKLGDKRWLLLDLTPLTDGARGMVLDAYNEAWLLQCGYSPDEGDGDADGG